MALLLEHARVSGSRALPTSVSGLGVSVIACAWGLKGLAGVDTRVRVRGGRGAEGAGDWEGVVPVLCVCGCQCVCVRVPRGRGGVCGWGAGVHGLALHAAVPSLPALCPPLLVDPCPLNCGEGAGFSQMPLGPYPSPALPSETSPIPSSSTCAPWRQSPPSFALLSAFSWSLALGCPTGTRDLQPKA